MDDEHGAQNYPPASGRNSWTTTQPDREFSLW